MPAEEQSEKRLQRETALGSFGAVRYGGGEGFLCHIGMGCLGQGGRDFQMPILHLSQLIGVAAGLADSELKFKRHVVSVDPVLEKLSV